MTVQSAVVGPSNLLTATNTVVVTNKTFTTPVINGFTGSTAAINIGGGQVVKDTSGNVGIGANPATYFSATKSVTTSNASGKVTNELIILDGANYHRMGMFVDNTAGKVGLDTGSSSGSYSGLSLRVEGSEKALIDRSGNLLVTTVAGIGYGTGAGSTATQPTNQGTNVTLNKPTGVITMASGAGSASWQYFKVLNSIVSRSDTVTVTPLVTNTNLMLMIPFHIWDGYFYVAFYSWSGTTTDTPKFQFNVHKGATA